jgi:hypothetical protein
MHRLFVGLSVERERLASMEPLKWRRRWTMAEPSLMPARCLRPEKIALNRDIRENIGERLREHYNLARQIPLPERLAELAKQFGQPLDARGKKPIRLG